jgi:hypothetical protein
MRARVPVQANSSASARAGIMLRETADPNSKHASIYVTLGFGFRLPSPPLGTPPRQIEENTSTWLVVRDTIAIAPRFIRLKVKRTP